MTTVDPEFRSLIPPLTANERAGLESDLLRDGCRDPLLAWGGTLLDGHNRLVICEAHDLPYEVSEVNGIASRDAAKLWILRNQFHRRNLTTGQKAQLAARYMHLFEADARERMAQGGRGGLEQGGANLRYLGKASEEAADLLGVSPRTVEHAARVERDGVPELSDALASGEVTVSAASEVATLPPDEQRRVVARGSEAVAEAASKVRRQRKADKRRQERMVRMAEQSAGAEPLEKLPGRFPVILADPPWAYRHCASESRAIENHYPTMSHEELLALRVTDVSTDDAVLFLWTTPPKVAEAVVLIAAWGFDYKTCAVWDKGRIGPGYYFRQQHELLLVATRGTPPPPAPGDRVSSVFQAPRTEHSRKPDAVHEAIETMYPELPRLELFSRRAREGWVHWGAEA